MVSLACVASTSAGGSLFVRNAIAHELGHNLGLDHGGDEACNYKPNYSSVMNYRYEFQGVDTHCTGAGDPTGNATLDYSHGDRLTLDENNLDETAGMCTNITVPVDWNFDQMYETAVVADINPYSDETYECGSSVYTVLHDYNDWAHLDLASVSPMFFGQGAGPTPEGAFKSRPLNHGIGCAPIPESHR
jgi:hypothetical protein